MGGKRTLGNQRLALRFARKKPKILFGSGRDVADPTGLFVARRKGQSDVTSVLAVYWPADGETPVQPL